MSSKHTSQESDLNLELNRTLKRLARENGTTAKAVLRHSIGPAEAIADLVRKERKLPAKTVIVVAC